MKPGKMTFTVLAVILFTSCFTLSPAVAENVITSGTKLILSSGTRLISIENMVVKSGATLSNAGTLILNKNLTNENAAANSIGTGTAEFSGTINQSISGQNIFQNLTIKNATGVTIGGNTSVNGILTLTTGIVTLGSNNLLLGNSATIAGTPSAAAMIVATGTGELRKGFVPGFTGSFLFPLGDATGTAEYSPVTLTFNGGTFGAGNYAGVKLSNSAYPGLTGNFLKRGVK